LDREETTTVDNLEDDDCTSQEDHEDDEGAPDEKEIWKVTDVTEETSKRLRVRRWICMTNSWRWWGGPSQRMT
jgi:hypothetical protein